MLRNGICSICKSENNIAKKLPSIGLLCFVCNNKRLNEKKEYSPSIGKYQKKAPTGERELFLSLWQQRPHYSFVSNKYLGDEPLAHFFSHILPKSRYNELRLQSDNIVFMTLAEHQLWEFSSHEKLSLLPEWQKVFDLKEKLLTNL